MLPILVLVLFTACSTGHGPLVSKIPDDQREFKIVRANYSARQAAAMITFSSSFGIFAFDVNTGGRKLNRATLIVKNQRYCEGLPVQDRSGRTIDLLRHQGVQVRQERNDLVIEIKRSSLGRSQGRWPGPIREPVPLTGQPHGTWKSVVALFFMDYPQLARLKILGHARVEDARQHLELVAQFAATEVRRLVERLLLIKVSPTSGNANFNQLGVGLKWRRKHRAWAVSHEPILMFVFPR